MKERLERLLDETIPNWRSMPREELLEMIFDMLQKAEQEHGDGYADKVAEYAECRATIKMMLDSM